MKPKELPIHTGLALWMNYIYVEVIRGDDVLVVYIYIYFDLR